MRNKKQKGFTLIELLVVIAIIGLLASVVLVALNGAREKSREAKRLADVSQMSAAFELMFNDSNAYPTGANSAVASGYSAAAGAILGNGQGLMAVTTKGTFNLTPTYIGLVPYNPTPIDSGTGAALCNTAAAVTTASTAATPAAGPTSYIYQTNLAGTTYTLSFCLGGSGSGSYVAGGHFLTPQGVQ